MSWEFRTTMESSGAGWDSAVVLRYTLLPTPADDVDVEYDPSKTRDSMW